MNGIDQKYPVPLLMIGTDNNKLYAYITCVLSKSHIAGAIVLAYSIRKLESKADLVVFTSNKINEEGQKILAMYFNKIIQINPSENPEFDKFNLFNLPYKKVIYISPDSIVLAHPDHLFTLNAPAGFFIENINRYIQTDSKGNYILPTDWPSMKFPHGSLIPKSYTETKNIFGIGQDLLVLEPKVGEAEEIFKDIKTKTKIKLNPRKYLTLRYSGNWTSIAPGFYGLDGYPVLSELFIVLASKDKPFLLSDSVEISVRVRYPHFILFHKYYGEILKTHPELSEAKVLAQPNQMHKYFTVDLASLYENKRLLPKTPSVDPTQIIRKLNLPTNTHIPNPSDYFLDETNDFYPINLPVMFSNIKPFDYIEPIKKLAEQFTTSYYSKILEKIPESSEHVRLDTLLENSGLEVDDIDNIMLNYVKCMNNTTAFILWGKLTKYSQHLISELEKTGNVYYLKHILLSGSGLENLLWVANSNKNFSNRKANSSNINKYKLFTVSLIIYGNINKKDLSSSGSYRRFIGDFLNNICPEQSSYISEYFYQTVGLVETLLNQNTLGLIDGPEIRLENLAIQDIPTHLRFQSMKKFIYSNSSPLEVSKIIFSGSTVLYAHQIINPESFKGMGTDMTNPEFIQLIYDNFASPITKIPWLNIELADDSWKKANKIFVQMLDTFDVNEFDDLLCNPRYHMYFQGLKMYTLEHEIIRKYIRSSNSDISDLIYILLFSRDLISKYLSIDESTLKIIIKPELERYKPEKSWDKLNIIAIYEKFRSRYRLKAHELTPKAFKKLLS